MIRTALQKPVLPLRIAGGDHALPAAPPST